MAQSKLTSFFTLNSASGGQDPDSHEKPESSSNSTPSSEVPLETDKSGGQKTPKKTGTNVKRWQSSWLSEFSWLRFDSENGTMYCITCEKFDKAAERSMFVKGCKNYQRSALVRHQTESNTHLAATQAKKQSIYMKSARKIVAEKNEPILEAQLRTALYMAKENTANRKFLNLVDLQVYHVYYCTRQS